MPTTPRHPLNLRYRGVILPAVGPCMFLAPVVFLVGIVAILCWPFVVVAAVPLWGLTWLVERALLALGVTRARGLFAASTRVMALVAKPWTYYDVPDAKRALPDAPPVAHAPDAAGDDARRADDPPA